MPLSDFLCDFATLRQKCLWIVRFAMVFVIFTIFLPVFAQEEIPFFQSTERFNIPILSSWQDESTDRDAIFISEELNSQIQVTVTQDDNVEAGVLNAIAEAYEPVTADAIYSEKVNLSDGTWLQTIYPVGEQIISSMTQFRNGKTYTISFAEAYPDANAYIQVIPSQDGVDSSLQAIQNIFGADIVPTETSVNPVPLPSGEWMRHNYAVTDEHQLTTMVLRFGNVDYVTVIDGDPLVSSPISNSFNTVFLGFFTTPDNDAFLYLGLGLSFLILFVLIGSFFWRQRNAHKDLEMIENLTS